MPIVSEIFNIDVFKILQYGVSGFAVVLLYLGYRLLHQLINIKDVSSSFKPKLTAVIIFMFTSLLFFAGGIFGDYITVKRANPIVLLITPSNMPDGVEMPTIRQGIETIELKNSGAIIKVKSDEQVTVQVESLINQINRLKATLPHVAALNSTLEK